MTGIFIRSVTVENYKCFPKQTFDFSTPDGKTPGSGLNVLIGENGTGKTALLEALNYANQSAYATENRLQIHDFFDHQKPIQVSIKTDDYTCKMEPPYFNHTFDCDGIEFNARSRDRKSAGKLLSSSFSIHSTFRTKTGTYRDPKGKDTGKEIPALHKTFSNSSIEESELNVFYFDKNRTRQLTTGNYRTTFERICDDLNWKFIKNLEDEDKQTILDNISGAFFSNVLAIAQKGTGKKLAEEMASFFSQEQFKNLRIDLLDLLHPFTASFFAVRGAVDLKQIKPKDLGSGVEIVLTLLLLRTIASESKGSIVYLLDEPELHLHPKAQQKLVDLLLEESKTKQIIISTHSPYVIKGCMLKSTRKLIFRRGATGTVDVQDTQTAWGGLPWSPSWGEINYVAYDLSTVEYHNELYGWLQEKHSLAKENDVEQYLVSKNVPLSKKWSRLKAGSQQQPYDVSLSTYVRNSIHHPESSANAPFSEPELRGSIEILRTVI